MRLGFESAGASCVFTSEWNKFARMTYEANFQDGDIAGDITRLGADEIPGHDVLLAGFPCQPFSLAGVSKKNSLGRSHGFLDEAQGTLFFDIARIIEYHRPKAFLLENVKNLKNHDRGNTFNVIRRVLTEELGYSISFDVLDAGHFVPQHRERLFIAGFLNSSDFSFERIRESLPERTPSLGQILHPEDGSQNPESPYTLGEEARVNPKYTLSPRLWEYLQGYAAKHRAKGNGFGFGLVGPEDVARTLSARYYKDGSEILIKQPRRRPRRLTPRECSRLMGFDQPTGSTWRIPVSDNQAYRQFGNSVVPELVGRIAEPMLKSIGESASDSSQRMAA